MSAPAIVCASAQLAAAAPTSPQKICLGDLRAAMLADVGDQVSLMKHDLADLLRGLRP